jgi:hypothetical protein
MTMKYDKIFVIGTWKCGTASLHRLFTKLGLKSLHSSDWDLRKYQCFSNGQIYRDNINDFTELYEIYPNSLFILNTRPLNDWLMSIGKHTSVMHNHKNSPHKTADEFVKFCKRRKTHHADVLNFFSENNPNKLIIASIQNQTWTGLVASALGYNFDGEIKENVINENELTTERLSIIKEEISKAHQILNHSEEEKYSLNLNEELLPLFKHNV